ncbi:YicC/YloC family endoribonuclease [Nisaea sp.]|uniref:YicC/YloC family endoribonuclease n=1 Tax=Nisaea sp. TaxID=2024842 RepID=UPI002B26A29B|nr:YicC/YloC family endoribonuclease [Nisaea sp.]
MAINSMTGYARVEGTHDAGDGAAQWQWSWEVKSVNGKGLDIRFRLPGGFDALEIPARKLIGTKLGRGSLSVSLMLSRQTTSKALTVNRELIEQILDLQTTLEAEGKIYPSPPRLDSLLSVRGILETEEEPAQDPAHKEALIAALLAGLETVLKPLSEMRGEEGVHLGTMLTAHLDTLAGLSKAAKDTADLQPGQQRERMKQQIAEILEQSPPVSEERLGQELALLATKADIREEVDRLDAHVAACRDLVSAGGVIGRKLDFICQELNRESNTICSKAASLALTNIGLELKSTVEQFREQVQNVE